MKLWPLILVASLPAFAVETATEPLSPSAAAGAAIAPPGFSVDVIASEPDIAQPIALAWDHRGRLWIAECRTYSDRSDNFDLTESDRIVVLEDRDADGEFETRTVFAENLQRLTGIEIGFGGVWALTSPTMVFIPDADGDLKPDGPAVIKLDGFDLKYTRHTIANGLKWGPDGWLYGRQGIVAISELGAPGAPAEERLSIDTGIWRYHPDTHKIEAWTRGGTNPWGHDWNAEGELFYINTVIGHFWHGIPGAYTKRMFGQHQRPYLYRLIDMHADHWHFDIDGSWTDTRENVDAEDAFGGGHAHSGLMIYQADKWPAEYRGDVFALNFHGRRLNRERLHREGSGFVAKHQPDFVKFTDRWFRGIDLAQGPDGDVYVLDWSDTGECHDHEAIDRDSGRVYRIRCGEPASGPVTPPETLEEVDGWLRHPNVWFARHARLILQERRAAGDLPSAWIKHFESRLAEANDEVQAIRYLQALHAVDAARPEQLLGESREGLVVQALRLMRDDPASAGDLSDLARSGSSRIRLAIASLLPRLKPEAQVQIAELLVAHAADAEDHNYPLMVWYAIEPTVAVANESDVSRLLQACAIPELRRFIVRRLGEAYPASAALISKLILTQPEHAAAHLSGLADALEGLPKAEPLPNWPEIAKLAPNDPVVNQLGATFGDGRSLGALFEIANDPDAEPSARRTAIAHLGEANFPDDLRSHLIRWIDDSEVSGVCASQLARYADDEAGELIIGRFAYLKAEERAAALEVIVSRASWSNLLLDRIAEKRFSPDILTTVHARQIVQHADPALTVRLNELWGEFNPSAADPATAEMESRLRKLITPENLKQSDPGAGREIFAQRCASCHQLYGSGGLIGPDLTGSGRHDLAYLLENILNPSAVVPAGYRLSVVKLKDGRTLSGVIAAQSEKRVSLITAGLPEPTFLLPADIESIETLSLSLMPAGLINDLSDEQLRDLFGYLMGDHQAPLR